MYQAFQCAFTRWEWRRMPNLYEFWLQFRHGITVRFPKLLTNSFGSSLEIPEVHHELSNFYNYAVIKKIANLRTKGSISRESSNFASYEFLKLQSASKLFLKLNWYFIMADLSTWIETFKDKMDDKSYQPIFDILFPRAVFPGFGGGAGKGPGIGRSQDQ